MFYRLSLAFKVDEADQGKADRHHRALVLIPDSDLKVICFKLEMSAASLLLQAMPRPSP